VTSLSGKGRSLGGGKSQLAKKTRRGNTKKIVPIGKRNLNYKKDTHLERGGTTKGKSFTKRSARSSCPLGKTI